MFLRMITCPEGSSTSSTSSPVKIRPTVCLLGVPSTIQHTLTQLGHVTYVDQATAQSSGLIKGAGTSSLFGEANGLLKGASSLLGGVSGGGSGGISWGVDTSNVAPSGRQSVRISSKKAYESGLVVLDVEHMPTGCGTWPAFWMLGPTWPTKYDYPYPQQNSR